MRNRRLYNMREMKQMSNINLKRRQEREHVGGWGGGTSTYKKLAYVRRIRLSKLYGYIFAK